MAEEKIKSVSYPVINQAGEKVSTVRLAGEVFGIEPHKQTMFDAVQVYQANMRQATAKTKKRDEVSGGGKKPWRQKGTGRARAGSSRSPIWVGGGKVFGPTGEQNFKLSMNKVAHNLALRSALSVKAQEKSMIILDDIKVEAKTRLAVELFVGIKASGKILVVCEADDNLALAVRNLANVKVVGTDNVSVYDLLNADNVVFTKAAVKAVEGGLK